MPVTLTIHLSRMANIDVAVHTANILDVEMNPRFFLSECPLCRLKPKQNGEFHRWKACVKHRIREHRAIAISLLNCHTALVSVVRHVAATAQYERLDQRFEGSSVWKPREPAFIPTLPERAHLTHDAPLRRHHRKLLHRLPLHPPARPCRR